MMCYRSTPRIARDSQTDIDPTRSEVTAVATEQRGLEARRLPVVLWVERVPLQPAVDLLGVLAVKLREAAHVAA